MGFRGGGKHEVEMLLCCSYKVGKGRESFEVDQGLDWMKKLFSWLLL